ncbi:MAG: bifunctional metallophosphatase/5'-nucleotidase, partial [Methanobacteriaceae archaeon]|nr:bifunctional metallophosphatase/5'-nucleotidase [Methanobacteriaceae archaeon]
HPHHQMAGGYSRIKSLFNEIREKNQVLALDCGDTLHGTYPVVKSRGESMVPLLNEMGYGAMTAHWEFAYGPEHFHKLTRQLNYPMLAVNCYQEKNDRLVYAPYTIISESNLQIGVIGVAATIVDKVMPPHFSEGIYFTLGNQELPLYIEKLKNERVDLIILISHLGFPQEVKLAGEVPGIDVILSSHTHNRLVHPVLVNGTIIIQSGCHGSFIGRLDLDVENKEIKSYEHQLITVKEDITPDENVEEMVKKVTVPYQDMLTEKVGETRTALNRNTLLESTMDNLLLKSILASTDADVAFSNGWRYGAPVPPGPITMKDLWNIIPVNPPVSTVELTGREIWHMLEENAELTFSCDPYQQMGGYLKRVLGLNFYLKIENPPGERLQEIFIKGKRLDPNQTYQAVFVTSQGVPFHYGTKRKTLDTRAIDTLRNYILNEKTVESPLEVTVVAV